MLRKTTFLLSLMAAFSLFHGCGGPCADVDFPYYDFEFISIEIVQKTSKNNPIMVFQLTDEQRTNLAVQRTSFSFIQSAYARSCLQNGDEGRKYPVTFIDITSDAAFDSLHPAGSSLNGIFEAGDGKGTSMMPDTANADYFNGVNHLGLLQNPVPNQKHTFSFTLTKSNGQQVTGFTTVERF